MAPSTTKQWTVEGKNGFDSLKFHEKAQIPSLGEKDVLVHFYAASLNYRDLAIPKVISWRFCSRTQISNPLMCRVNTRSP